METWQRRVTIMTIATTINRKEYTGNGVNDTFAYTFWISADGDLKVYVDSVLQTITTHYTVTNADEPSGGNVIFEAGYIPADQSSVVIWRDVPKTQGTDYVGGEKFSAETHEKALDRLTVITQQLQDDMDRCIKMANTVTDSPTIELDFLAAARASRYVGFDENGDISIAGSLGTYQDIWTTSSAYIIGDVVYDGTNGASTYNVYWCAEAHTSGVWATDLAAGKWELAIDVDTITQAAETAQAAAEDAQSYAEEWANKAEDSLVSAAAGGDQVDDYSSLHHKEKALDAQTAAETAQTAAETAQTLASQWASLVDALVAATDYSAKEYAIGTTVAAGSSKDWAIQAEDSVVDGGTGYSALHHSAKANAQRVLAEAAKTAAELAETNAETAETNADASATLASQWASLVDALVAATDYSAKEYAIGTTVAAGSAKDWATQAEDSLVDGASYSALHHAAKAAASAAAAATTLAAAIRDDTAGEINAVADKATPVGADIVLIEDSEDSWNKKKIDLTHVMSGAGTDTTAIHDNQASEISAVTEKASPVDADLLLIEDSAAANAKKRVQVGNLPLGTVTQQDAEPGTTKAGMFWLDTDAVPETGQDSIHAVPETGQDSIHASVSGEIIAVTEKSAPVGADVVLIEDTEASNAKKRVQVGNLPYHDNLVMFSHRQSSGTNGGTATTGAWNTCPINTEDYDPNGWASVSTNLITLAAGTYEFDAFQAVYKTSGSMIRLYNNSDTAVVSAGPYVMAKVGDNVGLVCVCSGVFTIATSKNFYLQYRVNATQSTNGLGVAQSWGEEVYAMVKFRRII
jgi:hypothetical protein